MPIPDPVTIDPASPQHFAEAVDYFRRQAPWISGSSWATMARLSAQKGDQVSGAAVLAMVDDVFRRIDKSLVDGTPYSEFVRDMGKDFHRDWVGVDSYRLSLIYHNNVGSALMAGRMAQITDPDVVSARPYFLFDAIEDFRTSDICQHLGGVVRPASDTFWSTRTPLLHHQCRSTIISLDEEDMRAEGGLTRPSKLTNLPAAESGFGRPYSWEDRRPSGTDADYVPALWNQYVSWRDGQPYAHERSEWLSVLSKSWSEPLGVDEQDLRRVLELPPETPRDNVRQIASQVRPPAAEAADDVRYYLDQWVVGSKRKASVTLKRAAIEELNLPGVAYSRAQWKIPDEDVRAARGVVRKTYEDTQDALRQAGFTSVRLYRGVKSEYEEVGALESWTKDQALAKKFDGGGVLVRDVPVEHVLAYSGGPNWKNGKYGEQHEYVVMSSLYRKEVAE